MEGSRRTDNTALRYGPCTAGLSQEPLCLPFCVDLDGTIINSAPGIIGSYQHALRCMGAECPPAEELTWVVGPPSRRSFPKLIGPDQDVEEAVRLYRAHYEQNGLLNGTVYPGMQEALTDLYALPARLFVCTAKPQGFAERIIEHFGLGHLFERMYGADLEGKFDDKGLLIEHIIGVEQIDPAAWLWSEIGRTTCWQRGCKGRKFISLWKPVGQNRAAMSKRPTEQGRILASGHPMSFLLVSVWARDRVDADRSERLDRREYERALKTDYRSERNAQAQPCS